MDPARMLEKCIRDQWSLDDLDWSVAPPAMSRDKEEAIVQAFTNMAAIELLAAALFEVQRKNAADPTLAKIFATFVADEKRHAAVATRLAQHYDVHQFRPYAESPSLTAFRPHFLVVVEEALPELANAYITAGELILDVALLRSLDDYVADATSHAAMQLINRDESRHIAIDFHMTEKYSSDEHIAVMKARPWPGTRRVARHIRTIVTMMWHAKPFFQQVFVAPMDRTDPSGRRILEAIKRVQLLMRKPTVARMGFPRFISAMQRVYNTPVIGALFGNALLRALGADDRAARYLFTPAELAASQRMSFDELAEEALSAKYS
ncbi:MAG TPA: hypothetical protein VGG74_30830 [Kofleriaceae bacterium]